MASANVYDAVDKVVRDNSLPAGGPPIASVARAIIGSDNVQLLVGAGGQLLITVPTNDPHVVGAIYSSTGTLHVSAG
jgi:hypothetical protein